MSGGSFDYLCYQDAEELFKEHRREDLARMAQELRQAGHEDAAQATEQVLEHIERALLVVGVRVKALQDVWREAEWVASGDAGFEKLRAAVERWRSFIEAPVAKP